MTPRIETEVLVIGGGPTGLILSSLLSQLGVRNVVAEKREDMGTEPKAHLIRHRTMEILGQLGIADAALAARPALSLDYITWCASLAGKEIGRLGLNQSSSEGEGAREPWINLSQSDLHPILLQQAEQGGFATILKGTECVGLVEDASGITASLKQGNDDLSVRARYVVAADGASSATRASLDIAMDGLGATAKLFMVHFEADLRPLINGREGPLYWIMNPQAMGSIIVHDPAKSHVFMTPVFGIENEEESLPDRLATALGVDIPLQIHSTGVWVAHKQIATQYKKGRVFLLGDAAHRFPPTGGLGLNTGAAEAHNLAWKLALVLKGNALPALLGTYEQECRAAAQKNADDSLVNMKNLGLIGSALGHPADLASLETSLTHMSGEARVTLDEALEMQRKHFLWDGALPRSAFRKREYIERRPISYGVFTLHAPSQQPWSQWAERLTAETGVTVHFACTNEPHPQFENTLSPSVNKAILVRPDGLVEWIEEDDGMSEYDDVKEVMNTLLSGKQEKDVGPVSVGQLGYIGLEVPKLAPWEAFFRDNVGLLPVADAPEGSIAFRVDEYEHRFIVEEGPADDVAFVGWEVKDGVELGRLRAQVEAAGVVVTVGSLELASRRRVEECIYFEDPDGVRTEVFWGPRIATEPFHSANNPEGFVTGECGLGHVVFGVNDRQKTFDFYTKVLGFRLSDYIKAEPIPDLNVHITFLHANSRHHSLAFVELPFPTKLQHFMLEVKTMSSVGRAYDRFQENDAPIALSLGHHPNDECFSFYAKAPNGIEIEIGWNPLRIDDEVWQPRTYNELSDWGHQPPASNPAD